MKLNMKLNYLIVLLCSWVIFSCEPSTSAVKKVSDIPELITRSEKIQQGKEWDFVQNFYSDQKEALNKDPKDHNARLQLAELFIKEARVTGEHGHYYPAALKLLNKILESGTTDSNILFQTNVTKAGVQLSLHEFKDALATAQNALKLNGTSAQIYGVLVDCYVELGDYDKAVAAADKMISIKPDIRSYSRIAYLREIYGDVDGSIKALSLAIKSGYPGYEETAWAMQTLGELYTRYGKKDLAEKVYNEILQTREDYPFAIAAIGDLRFQEGDIDNATKKIQEAMDIIPEVGYYLQMAHIYKLQEKDEELKAIVKEIFAMLEDDVQAGHNMNLEYADMYLHLLDDPEKALEYAQKELEKRPKNIDVNRLLSNIYIAMGDKDMSSNHLAKAKVTGSKHPELKEIESQI